jgi:hypothetical protein
MGTLLTILVACAEPGKPAVRPPVSEQADVADEPVMVTEALRHARQHAALALALTPPKYEGDGEKADALSYMRGPLATWIKQRRDLQDRALAEFARIEATAARVSPFASEGVGELNANFAEHFVAASQSAMPRSVRSDSEAARAFADVLREVVEPQFSDARAAFLRCASKARDLQLEVLKARCDQRLATLPLPPTESAQPRVRKLPNAPSRSWLRTSQPRPCVFAGSLKAYEPLFSTSDVPEPVAHLSGAFAVEVAELAPALRGGRTRVDLSWPVHATWWLAADAMPLELVHRLEIVSRHVWLEPGSPVMVRRRTGATLEAALDLTKAGRRRVEPTSLRRTIRCSELRLASNAKSLWTHDGDRATLREESLSLLASPGGKQVARVQGGAFFAVYVLERRGTYAHIVGNNVFVFDGWVEAKHLAAAGPAMLGEELQNPHSHVVTTRLPLRSEPRTSAPVVADLVPGALVKQRATSGGFTGIDVVGLGEIGRSRPFFVDSQAFELAATAAR